ncbi:MAG TPA: cupin domain-containing protein [Gammaproteobacteria bacterium]|jgi:quercetin dioxygenase-like cupin family protein|nr:cupin domain-containing protein [Gammaproteobacteria bacterium]MDP6733908.1 cupin domain-containing protein [Gammaproteobacteria bacterium]HAJ74887.1 cupin domain-containing protein [Gammaproteobacteria bacterium]|tara:strand:+ start:250 stop:621 length:372 start_codon:yes stop_codon:yes gene_type:complete
MSSEALQSINWQEIELETVNESMQRRIVTGENITVARIYFKDGFTVPMHDHHNEQITQVIKGQMRFLFGGDDPREIHLNPGDVVVIPPNVPHQASCIGAVEQIDTWSPPREDWLDGSDDYLRS